MVTSDQQTTLFHGGAYEITKAHEPQAGIVVQVFDMEEDASSVAPMTPAEWDAFVAAGNAALGRPAPTSTPLEERIAKAIAEADEEADAQAIKNAETQDLADGRGEGLRAALAMVREQGATVPRAGVADALAPVLAIHAQIAEESGEYRANLIELLLSELDKMREALTTATTTKETPGHADD